jgi:hypothetical protein
MNAGHRMNNQQSCLFQPLALSFPMAFFLVCRPQCLHGTYSQSPAPGRSARSTPSDLLEGSNREFEKSKISRFQDGPWWCASLALENCLAEFFKAAWPHFDPAPYTHRWHIDAIAERLEA